MDIEQLLTKHSDNYRFHGVQGATLRKLIGQSENGQIVLWGQSDPDGDFSEYVQGAGSLYVTDISGIGLSYKEFACEDGLVLVLEKQIENPQESFPRAATRIERLIETAEWRVIGGLRATSFDEDGDYEEDEAISLSDILSENF